MAGENNGGGAPGDNNAGGTNNNNNNNNNGGDPWFKGAEQDVLGHLQAHGWDKKTPAEAAIEAAKSHFNLQKMTGVPADRLARIPEPNDAAGWQALFAKLGVPAEATAYDYKALKFADGAELDASYVTWLQGLAKQLQLRPAEAAVLGQELVKRMDADEATEKATSTAKLQTETQALEREWGGPKGTPKYDNNLLIAKNTAQKLGVDVEALNTLEGKIGYAKVMDMFRKIGAVTGEAEFFGGGGGGRGGGGATMTLSEAVAKRDTLMADSAWVTRYQNQDAVAMSEMGAIMQIIANANAPRRAA